MSQAPIQRDHHSKIMQTTVKGRVSSNGRYISIPCTPKDMPRISDKATISNKASEERQTPKGQRDQGQRDENARQQQDEEWHWPHLNA